MNLPTDQARIRVANTTDVLAIARIVEYAYRPHLLHRVHRSDIR